VTLLARGEMATALSTRGLTLHSARGGVTDVGGLTVATSPQEAFASAEYDWLAFTMKAYDTVAAIHELEAITKEPPPVLCIQNGVGNEESLASAFGPERVVAGTLTTVVVVVAPGVVREEKVRGLVVADDRPAAQRVLAALRETSLDVRTTSRTDSLKWSKLLLNQTANATSAILDMPPGDVFAHRDLFIMEHMALLETLGVMRAQGIPAINLPGIQARTLAFLIQTLPRPVLKAILTPRVRRGRGGKMPSLHQDLSRGRRSSEVVWINGAVARAGEAVGLHTPVNDALALTLMDIIEGRAEWEQFRGHPEMLLAAVRVAR
jgi:2-dehydropantoate 2-reductase